MKFLKKHFPLLVIALVIFSIPSKAQVNYSKTEVKKYAEEVNVPAGVLSSFAADFKNVADVNWTTEGQVFKVSFLRKGNQSQAYYTNEGEYLGVGQYVTTEFLTSMNAVLADTKYKNETIKSIFEYLSKEEGIIYYVHVENAKNEKILKLDSYEHLQLMRSFKKS